MSALQGKHFTVTITPEGGVLVTPVQQPPATPMATPIPPFTFGPNGEGWFLDLWGGTHYRADTVTQMMVAPGLGNCFPSEATANRARDMHLTSSRWISAALAADSDAGPWAPGRQWTAITDCNGGLRVLLHFKYEQCPCMPYVHTEVQAKQMMQLLQNAGWA